MHCYFCNKDAFKCVNGKAVCHECFIRASFLETSIISYFEWEELLFGQQEKYDNKLDYYIARVYLPMNKSVNDKETALRLISKLENEIIRNLSFYSKNAIYISLLTLKELIQRALLMTKFTDKWAILQDAETYIELVKLFKKIDDNKYMNHSMGEIDHGDSRWKTSIIFARRINIIRTNLDISHEDYYKVEENVIESRLTSESEKYFDEYLNIAIDEKPEDYRIQNDALKKSVERRKKTPTDIIWSIDKDIKKQLGFSISDLRVMAETLMSIEFAKGDYFREWLKGDFMFEITPLQIIPYNEFEDIMCEKGVDKEAISKIISFFSINSIDNESSNETISMNMSCKVDNELCFGVINFTQCVSTFEKCILANHYLNVFKIEKNRNIIKSQKKLSQYFSACIVDVLILNGYSLPTQIENGKETPRYEINKMVVNGINILKSCGDIDVLSYDRSSNTLIIFEAKFYEPLVNNKNMESKDRNRINSDEVIRKMKKREEIVIKYQLDFMQLFGISNIKDSHVKSYLISSRVNYYGINSMSDNYLTWRMFKEKAEAHSL